ncbi:MAG: citrate transporter [Lachnospiraceae bacterium]|nr:citrate transporter [Lachnospiraceae bacterium]MBQ5660869.1 citrate transporter [Lachnospiraceae bacterium]
MKQKMIAFFKSEFVLCIAAVCAVISMFFVPPSAAYLEYIDLRTLCLLFCLMALVAGFGKCNVFRLLAQTLLSMQKNTRGLSVVLILLPFFSSMLITNDVALITFVPFTLLVLSMCGHMEAAPVLIVFQTIAANLGSMATPFGNPQNLFLYANYELSAGDFFGTVVPIAAVSFVCLLICGLTRKSEAVTVNFTEKVELAHPKLCLMFAALFVLTLLSVFHVVHYAVVTVIVAVLLFFFSKDLLGEVDYMLLITFVCFFVFAGNIGVIPSVNEALSAVMEKNALLTSILASQVISNVPAAVLLSGFTENWQALLAGTNIAGLGTPIASMASLISLKLYMKSEGARSGFYMMFFTAANVIGLVLLTGFYMVLCS